MILPACKTERALLCVCKTRMQMPCLSDSPVRVCVCNPLPRYALQDMDKFSLKDSGRGDSEAGDSDCDMGRESPVDRLLLGEGFSDLIHLEMHRLHPGELCGDAAHLFLESFLSTLASNFLCTFLSR